MIHVPGILLAGPDTLSHCPDLLPHADDDNDGVTLLLPSLFVNIIDMALSHRIESTSTSDPLVLQAVQSMNKDVPLPFHSCLSDWQVKAGILSYQGRVYVSNNEPLHHSILQHCHEHETTGILDT